MTVCAAAICQLDETDTIIGISDRKLTSGDIEFETRMTKIYGLGYANAVSLGSGETESHYAITTETHRKIDDAEAAGKTVTIRDVASWYALNFAAFRGS